MNTLKEQVNITKMTKVNINEEMAKDEKDMPKGGSNFYQIEEGNGNVCRVLTPAKSFISYFQGKGNRPAIAYGYDEGDPRKVGDGEGEFKPSARYACYVIDKNDGEVRLAEFPYSVQKAIGALQENPDYAFDSVPMPYDIRITYTKEEIPANKYSVAATPNKDEITTEQSTALAEKMKKYSPEAYVQGKKDAQMQADKEAGVWLSEEQRNAAVKEFVEQANANAPAPTENVKTVEYPKDDINPEDIPF